MSRTRGGIFTRTQGGVPRWYGRLPDGRRVALRMAGAGWAVTDPELAQALYSQLVADHQKQALRAVHGLPKETTLGGFAAEHLIAKAKAGRVTEGWIAEAEHHLDRAVAHFGAKRPLGGITVADVRAWAEVLAALPSGRRTGTLTGGTVRHHLNTLSNLFRRAMAEGYATFNPVAALVDKPQARRVEARWLEAPDAALLLEAARLYRPARDDLGMPFAYALLATLLLTGGRESEVLGLETDDISLQRQTVTFRPNAWRRLKTETSFRTLPLWPQLRVILKAYFPVRERLGDGTLLFPSYRTGHEAMLTDFRKLLDAVAERAGWKAGEIRSKMFRHTYASARLQTLDGGQPVSEFTVAKELGHGGEAMVRRVYGHLGAVRHRAAAVEYRVNQHAAILRERLTALRARSSVCDSVSERPGRQTAKSLQGNTRQ